MRERSSPTCFPHTSSLSPNEMMHPIDSVVPSPLMGAFVWVVVDMRPLTSRACPLREQTLDTLLHDAVFNIRGKYQVISQEISKQARVVFFLSESIVRLDDSIMEQCRIRMYNEAARIFISSLNSLPPRRFILPPAFIRTTADTSDILQAIDSPSRSGTSCMVKENAILQTKRPGLHGTVRSRSVPFRSWNGSALDGQFVGPKYPQIARVAYKSTGTSIATKSSERSHKAMAHTWDKDRNRLLSPFAISLTGLDDDGRSEEEEKASRPWYSLERHLMQNTGD